MSIVLVGGFQNKDDAEKRKDELLEETDNPPEFDDYGYYAGDHYFVTELEVV